MMNIKKLLLVLGLSLSFAAPVFAGSWEWSKMFLYGSSPVPDNPNLINCHYKYFLMYDGIAFYEYHADFVEPIHRGCPSIR